MSSVRDAIGAIISVAHDPDVSLTFDDRELLTDALGMLHDYVNDEV